MAGLYRDVARLLEDEGWFLHHQAKGSHEIWRRNDDPDGLEVSVPANLKKVMTAESIMKQAGLPKDAYKPAQRRARRKARVQDAADGDSGNRNASSDAEGVDG